MRRRRAKRPPRLPLEGYRVVELAHHLSAPLAAMYLGDFGADVVKVETLDGDDWRRWGRPSRAGSSHLFLAINRNKRSIALDTTRAEGRAVLDRLLASADVLVTNYAPEVLGQLGLDAGALRKRYPKLIPCSLSAFGSEGPDAHRRAFDIVVCGEMGLLLRHPDGRSAPLVGSAPVADTGGALMLAWGVALALLHRERGGGARAVETALANVPIALNAHRFVWIDGEAAPELAPPPMMLYRAYATSDGFITVAALAERLWRRLAGALGLDALLDDPRYKPWSALVARQMELVETLEARFRARTSAEWLEILAKAGVPAGRVNWGPQVFDHPQLHANDMVLQTRHPSAGRMRTMGFPLRISGAAARLRRHAPALGADTRHVLSELGYRGPDITRLIRAGVARMAPARRPK